MRTVYKDSVSAALAVIGGVVMFAKLNDYSWWLIGSWRGALGVVAVLGAAIMLTNARELFRMADGAAMMEGLAWLIAATVTIASLFSTTSKAEFAWSGALIGVAWLAQVSRHVWRSMHTPGHHYLPTG